MARGWAHSDPGWNQMGTSTGTTAAAGLSSLSKAATKIQAAVRRALQMMVWPFRRALILAQKAGVPPLQGPWEDHPAW